MGNEQTREEKIIEESAVKETQLECPVLVDLDHGTIRHRHEERLQDEHNNDAENEKGPVKVGYFYHPKLNDFSEDALSTTNNNRLKYVFSGPPKAQGKKLYYIYGTDPSAKDKGIHHEEYKPQGKGYNWPQSYRKANNLYYDILFTEKGMEEEEETKDKLSEDYDESDDQTSQSSGIICDKQKPFNKEYISLKIRPIDSVGNICERVSLQLLIPSTNIHLMWNKKELSKNDVVADLNEDKKTRNAFIIYLRLT